MCSKKINQHQTDAVRIQFFLYVNTKMDDDDDVLNAK